MWFFDVIAIILSLTAAYAPVILYAAFVWWLDRYEREPISLILLAFLWGALGSFVISLVLELLIHQPLNILMHSDEKTLSILSFTLAPAIEEVSKALLLFLLFFYYNFDNVTDGIVYGAIVGFGFSASENMLSFFAIYFSTGTAAWLSTILFRVMLTSLAHGVFTAMVGAGLGLVKTTRFRKEGHLGSFIIPLTLLAAIGMHSLFNLSALFMQYISPMFILVNLSLVLAGVTVLLLVMFIVLEQESSSIRRELLPELENGFITEGEYNIIPHYLKRKKASRKISRKYGKGKLSLLNRLFELETRLA
ncbi:MAG: PrsW family intramembrane metalloprotease, partial [Candidatus Altiarchaeota archaeon]|nr:PrsW family intramembrane metalloprotease [Candidatus Altiarchaeota archaeon]